MMKNIVKSGILALITVFAMTSCDPQEDSNKGLPPVIAVENIKAEIKVDATDPNLFHFKILTPECVGVFKSAQAGISKTGNEFSQRILWEGTYEVTVNVMNPGGMSEAATFSFTVSQTDPTVCENEIFQKLTGGCDAEGGKVWRIDGSLPGHIGCGAEDATSNNWWNPGPWDFDPALYDDDLIFFLNSTQTVLLDNKGKSFMNESTAELFPDGDSSSSFVTTHYTPSTEASWAIETKDGEDWLILNNAFPAYAVNAGAIDSGKYKILELTETHMHIVFLPGGISWHYYLTSLPRD
ncbi:hypothetical protein [Bacteroides sp. 214]|uniref:hypothetical protein n=1 Tax=Bacteroides sp. 214 TaxID=2302935 RepID=UPI0013D7E92E|nr:hypothetical protein [Bacteroides sp. 214]